MPDQPSLTPHQDAARACLEEMRTTLAADAADTGALGTRTRIIFAATQAVGLAVAREEDAGADPVELIQAVVMAAASVIGTVLRNHLRVEGVPEAADEAGRQVRTLILLGLQGEGTRVTRRVVRPPTRARQ